MAVHYFYVFRCLIRNLINVCWFSTVAFMDGSKGDAVNEYDMRSLVIHDKAQQILHDSSFEFFQMAAST